MDLDGDGRTDVLSGSFPGELYFFRRQQDGSFAAPEVLKDKNGKPIELGSASTVFAVDWDADGDLDLLVGNILGEVHFVPNESGSEELAFGEAAMLVNLGDNRLFDSHAVAADWDGDGRLDLVVAHGEGGVVWCRNIGTPQRPELARHEELVPPGPGKGKSELARRPDEWGARAKICVADWNGDGRMDLLLGDYCGNFDGEPDMTEKEQAIRREAKARLPNLQSQWAEAYRAYRRAVAEAGDTGATAASEKVIALGGQVQRLKRQIAEAQRIVEEFQPRYQSHGYVWLFLRKGEGE